MCDFISEKEWEKIPEEDRQKIAFAVKIAISQHDNEKFKANIIQFRESFYLKYIKRFLDIFISIFAIIVFLPINILLAIVTFFDVGMPLFFKQIRIGKNGKLFNLIKFRNMTNATNEKSVLLSPEMRITKWGAFTRKTSLDELLNFLCVLKGDMSIIGPRPLPEKYLIRFSEYHQQRHLVKPGLECPFINKQTGDNAWQNRLDNDVWYINNVSFITDIKMMFLLIKKVFSKKERENSATGKMLEFIGYNPDGTIIDETCIPRKFLKVINFDKNV